MAAGVRAVVGAAGGSKIFDYDGSLDGSINNVLSTAVSLPDATHRAFSVDHYGGLAAFCGYDGANLVIKVSNDNGANWTASPATIAYSGINTSTIPQIVVLSTTRIAVVYQQSPTKNLYVQTYSVSGTALTPEYSGNAVAAASVTADSEFGLTRASGSRLILAYLNASAYASSIGVTVSSSVSPDGAAAVAESSAATAGAVSSAVVGSTSHLVTYRLTTGSGTTKYALCTDGTTSTSFGTPVQITQTNGSVPLVIGGAQAAAVMWSGTGAIQSHMSVFQISSGAISDSFITPGTSVAAMPPVKFPDAIMTKRGAYLGETDEDGFTWLAMAGGVAATNKALLGFIGIPATGDPENGIRLCVKTVTATDAQAAYTKLAPIDNESFLLFFSDSSSDFKCKQINLA